MARTFLRVDVTPTITAGAHTDLDVVGGLMTFSINAPFGGFMINKVLIIDQGAQDATFRLHFYDSTPTTIADNAAYSRADGDVIKYVGYIDVSTYDGSDTANSVGQATDINDAFVFTGGALYCYATLNGSTSTYAATDDLTFSLLGFIE